MGTERTARGRGGGAEPRGRWEGLWQTATSRRTLTGMGLVLVAALLLGAGVVAYRLYAARQELRAQALLGEALTKAESVTEALQGGKPGDLKPEAAQEVLGALQKVREEYPRSQAAGLALLQVGHLQYRLRRYAEAARTYEVYLGEYPRGPFVFWAAMGQGYSLEGQEEWERAARVYEAAAERHGGTPLAAEALMGVGRCYEALSRPREAQAIYAEIVKKYPDTVWGSLAERRLAFLEAS
ncbi:MAG: tetratricopeptide repeat protein [candidate division NC10 bacterium]|nr:tetratricopeptide repeat protein [candidate division NC10 bacterium]